jgi:hypothetical protein
MKTSVVILAALLGLMSASYVSAGDLGAVEAKKVSVGVGFGIPYGVLGTNMDIHLVDNFDLSFGFGSTLLAGMGYNFGVKFHLASPGSSLRPRLSAYYGTNSVMENAPDNGVSINDDYYYYYKANAWGNSSLGDDYESYSGITVGFGTEIMFGASKANGIDLDVLYLVTTGYDKNKLESQGYLMQETGKVKFSLGYRHSF